jgi:hypothetical protein
MMARKAFTSRAASFLIAIVIGLGDGTAADSAESAQSSLGKLNEAASRYLAALLRVRGGAETVTHTGSKSDPKVILGDLTFHRNDGRTLVRRVLRSDRDPSLFREVVFASDTEHIFWIERLEKTKPFELKTFRSVKNAAEPGSDDFYSTLNCFLLAPVSISSIVSADIVRNPHFKLGRLERVSSPEETYRVHYELDDPTLSFGSGWFEVSPATGWLISKNSCRLGNLTSKNLATTTVEYGLEHAGQAIPKHVRMRQGYEQSPHINDNDFRLKLIADDDSDLADFRPAKYGLTDLSRLAKGRGSFSTGTMLLFLSPLVAIAAIAVRFLAHRRRAV